MKPTYRCCLVLVAVLLRRDVLSASTEKIYPEERITSENNGRDLAKRQTNFQNNDFGQQIPQEYFDLVQQTDATGTPVSPQQRPQFVQQNAQQQQVLATGSPPNVVPARPTLSPFALEQRRLLEEYRGRGLVQQLTALNRPRTRRPPVAQPQPPQFQNPALPASQQQLNQQGPLQFVDEDRQVREQEFVVPQQQNFVAPQQQVLFTPQQQNFMFEQQQQQQQLQQQQQQQLQQQQQQFAAQQQDVVAQQQEFAAAPQQGGVAPSVPSSEPFSYAQVQFGPVAPEVTGPPRGRSKGQRSVSRPAAANNVQFVDALTQQSVDRPVTTVDTVPAIEYPVTTTEPAVLGARLLQNVVYIQPNGQMYKPIEDVEPVVQIPRRIVSSSFSPEFIVSTTPVTSTSTSTTTVSPAEDEQPVVLIPQQPPPKKSQGRPRQEGRKSARPRPEITLQQHHEQQHQQHLRQHHHQQSSSEVEPDNFLTSLLARLQKQQEQEQLQPPEATVSTAVRPRGGSGLHRTKGYGSRSESSKYLADRNQLQLLQFPHELKALSTAELKALEQASVQLPAAANDKPVSHKYSSSVRNSRPITVAPPPPEPQPQQIESEPSTTAARLALGNRPVPTPVELNEQQRQFLASQGIRNLYRVDYDQYGNVLPLTYVLALDNRPKRAKQEQDQQ